MPILSWAIDTWESFYEMISKQTFDYNTKLYEKESYNNNIEKLFTQSPIKLNLGGESEKAKLVTTDRPTGIFDFSLASKGMYRVVEYYSSQLELDEPNKFEEYGLPAGVVPPDLVQQKTENGKKLFFYKENDIEYLCEIRQKGQTAIEQNIPNAKLKFSTRAKKVYLTYKRNRGKVRYVEIYSLFYYSRMDGDLQYAIRHIPAMMVAEYLESIGVKVRFYMTRYVRLGGSSKRVTHYRLRDNAPNGMKLPMADEAKKYGLTKVNSFYLIVQPIIAKDFSEEFNKSVALSISQRSNTNIYEAVIASAQQNEVDVMGNAKLYGDPDFLESQYYEGFERFRNKYQEYVKKGIFKSKEVLPEAMLFFHDLVLNENLNSFMKNMDIFSRQQGIALGVDTLLDYRINPFFTWWMKISATNLKNKINIINSDALAKDLKAMNAELEDFVDQLNQIVATTPKDLKVDSQPLAEYFKYFGSMLLRNYGITGYNTKEITFKNYIQKITLELTTYAEDGLYETPAEEKEKRDDLVARVFEALSEI
jgi:hypothetical protein